MGSLFRSEEMALCQLFLQSEGAYACVSELGELGVVQFRDLNPDVNAFQRKFVNEVRRCDEMERKLRFLEKEIKRDEIPMLDTGESPEAPQPREMIDLEATFEKLENELKEVNTNAEALKRNYLELTELKHILRKTQVFFDEVEYHHQMHDPSMAEESAALLGDEGLRAGGQAMKLGEQSANDLPMEGSRKALVTQDALQSQQTPVQLGYCIIRFVAGVILRERLPAFERMLWRACRGNVFLRQAEIDTPLEDAVSGDQVNKSVFIIFFQGDQLKIRVKKICEGFRATLYPCPETPAERREMAIGVMTRIEDLNTVLSQTQDHRHRVLVAAAKNIKNWFVKVRKIKAIYHTLNLFNLDVTQKCLIAECWCPSVDLETIQLALRRGTERSGSNLTPILNRMDSKEQPPTFNRTNKFTKAYQAIVDAYGVAAYREVNPTPFSVVTFPFLFAVMFGDAGHGFIMFLFALWMVLCEKGLAAKKIEDEIWNTFFGGRYIILMMGLFSIYTGLIYNDVFSKSINVFGSAWYPDYNASTIYENSALQLNATNSSFYYGAPYPFGVDPAWQLASNKLIFLNSYKMKMSIIYGVFQMSFGVVLGFWNHTYFRKRINIYCEFIPQLLFLNLIFGYLVILVFWKWVYYSAYNVQCAPSLLITLINMFLFKYPETKVCSQQPSYSGQPAVQSFLIILALLCVPWMLVVKPYILWKQNAAKHPTMNSVHTNNVGTEPPPVDENGQTQQHQADGNAISETPTSYGGEPEEEEFNFTEIIVHQSIHTIEYCLGCISNTASYLRLWALSLAHGQLSEVLWQMVMHIPLAMDSWVGAIMLFPVFAAWAVLTLSVLLVMEGLSAFLHGLRLHWVEFQNKFYGGTGYAFIPFSFDAILEAHSVSDD
uniref:V-type proton ATPase subunit a n=1 Tax=Strigamia maritima TaxID=126957 RepID=T1J3P7_STRMM